MDRRDQVTKLMQHSLESTRFREKDKSANHSDDGPVGIIDFIVNITIFHQRFLF